MSSTVPSVDAGARQRLTARFGSEIEPWFDRLPGVLGALAERWQLEIDTPIPRGSVSVVFRCRTADGRTAVLKASPDRARLAFEAAALEGWRAVHTPAMLALDEQLGALLLEAIEPGMPLVCSSYPPLESVAELLRSLHATGVPDASYPTVGQRIAYLFDSSAKLYERHPDLATLIPPELYRRGRRLATRLAKDSAPIVLLHGDLTPSNILDGGSQRGLVAIDPAPCLGDDLGYDALDLLLWQADDVDVIAARAEQLAPAIDVDAGRLLDWCTAFAAMTALELAEAPDISGERIQAAVTLANQAPRSSA
jgi:streptomycin 6-kinase